MNMLRFTSATATAIVIAGCLQINGAAAQQGSCNDRRADGPDSVARELSFFEEELRTPACHPLGQTRLQPSGIRAGIVYGAANLAVASPDRRQSRAQVSGAGRAPVEAPASGIVEFAGGSGSRGKAVLLRQDDASLLYLGGLEETAVAAGDRIAAGQMLGRSGASGAYWIGRKLPEALFGSAVQNVFEWPADPQLELSLEGHETGGAIVWIDGIQVAELGPETGRSVAIDGLSGGKHRIAVQRHGRLEAAAEVKVRSRTADALLPFGRSSLVWGMIDVDSPSLLP